MKRYDLVYRKLDDWDGPEFEVLAPISLTVREKTIPGAIGLKPTFIQRTHSHDGDNWVNLLTYTHTPLSTEVRKNLAIAALKWAKKKEEK